MLVQNKLHALAEQHVDMLESLAPAVRKRVDVLMEIQVKTKLLRLERASICGIFSFILLFIMQTYCGIHSDNIVNETSFCMV